MSNRILVSDQQNMPEDNHGGGIAKPRGRFGIVALVGIGIATVVALAGIGWMALSGNAQNGSQPTLPTDTVSRVHGSRTNPLPVGTTMETANWTVAVDRADFVDETLVRSITYEDGGPRSLEDGHTYLELQLTLTRTQAGSGKQSPWGTLAYISEDEVLHGLMDGETYIMAANRLELLETGASTRTTVFIQVPDYATESGALVYVSDTEEDLYFIDLE